MLTSLSIAFNFIKPKVLALISLAPFPIGVILGYVFKPEIKLAIDIVLDLVKVITKLI